MSWHTKKIKRVVRNTTAAETLSLQKLTDEAIFLQNMPQSLLALPLPALPILAIKDNKSVVEAILSNMVC